MVISVQKSDAIKNVCSNIGSILGISVTKLYVSRKISKLVSQDFGFCFSQLIPSQGYPYLNRLVCWLSFPREQIGSLLNLNELAQGILIAPYVEEVEFRLVLQQYLLKNLPKTLIEKYFPNHRINFDSALSKGARILITAAIFAILHLKVVECEKGGAISQFLGGVLYSSLIESGASILTTMNIHLMFNLLTHIDYTAF